MKNTRRFAFIAGLCAAAASAQAESQSTKLLYELSAAGVGAADFTVVAQFENGGYRIDAQGTTYGAVDLMNSLTVSAMSVGLLAGEAVQPQFFGTSNLYNGDDRRTRVTWTAGEAITQEIVPTLAEEERTAIPDDARQGALDPIAALLSFATGGPARDVCEGGVKVFDGRRSYTLALDAADGTGIVEQRQVGGQSVPALKCRITSVRTGGKSPDGWLSSSSDSEHALIWFWRDPLGRAIPFRIEANAPIGSAVAQLAALP
ncbi:hypothetical protein sos41_15130 [Alphaproteobacteria bacterium SO-S41]|nr:hypothetical protein sos41_15130 [Alphaproteobacteria bacterium SO-S41]